MHGALKDRAGNLPSNLGVWPIGFWFLPCKMGETAVSTSENYHKINEVACRQHSALSSILSQIVTMIRDRYFIKDLLHQRFKKSVGPTMPACHMANATTKTAATGCHQKAEGQSPKMLSPVTQKQTLTSFIWSWRVCDFPFKRTRRECVAGQVWGGWLYRREKHRKTEIWNQGEQTLQKIWVPTLLPRSHPGFNLVFPVPQNGSNDFCLPYPSTLFPGKMWMNSHGPKVILQSRAETKFCSALACSPKAGFSGAGVIWVLSKY